MLSHYHILEKMRDETIPIPRIVFNAELLCSHEVVPTFGDAYCPALWILAVKRDSASEMP
jgi:hypothetical protein